MRRYFLQLIKSLSKRRFSWCFIVVVVSFLCFPDDTFARTLLNETQTEGFKALAMIVDFLSWLWIIPATMAGALMSNSLAFGTAFHLDKYLFTMWQLMRTFSLFALGFMMIFGILKNFITFGEPKKYFEIIKKTVIAGVLISMSWYILAALVDLSVVATSAVGGTSLVVMEDQFKSMEGKIHCIDTITVKNFGVTDQVDNQKKSNRNNVTLEKIMPQGDSISGPLVFLGCGILNLSNTTEFTGDTIEDVDILLTKGFQLIINLMIVLPMIILMVVNMMRIFFIWLRAMFAPIIALDIVWGGPLTKEGGQMQKYFSPKNILGLLFQPVAVVACMSIGIIMILGLYDSQVGGETYDDKAMEKTFEVYPLSDNKAQVGSGALSESFINGTMLKKTGTWVGGVVGETIMSLFCIVIVWTLIKVGFSASEITKATSDKMFSMGAQLAKSVPIVPTSFGAMSVGALEKGAAQAKSSIQNSFRSKQSMQADKLQELMGIGDGDTLTNTETTGIVNAANDSRPAAMLEKIKEVQKDKPIAFDSRIKGAFQDWLLKNNKGGLNTIRNNPNYRLDINSFTPDNIANIWTPGGENETNNRVVRRFIDAFMRSNSPVASSISGGNDGEVAQSYNTITPTSGN